MAEDEFSGFSEDEPEHHGDAEVEREVQPKRNKSLRPTLEKDAAEEDLERLVFGDTSGFREQLLLNHVLNPDAPDTTDDTGLEHVDDTDLFALDTAPIHPGTSGTAEIIPELGAAADSPAWQDSDDERLAVSLATTSRLRKLRITEAEDTVNGIEYTRRLRQHFLRTNPTPQWARQSLQRPPHKRRRRRSAVASESGSDEEATSDAEDFAAQPLAEFLRNANSLATASKTQRLRPETLNIQRSRDVPVKHKARVTGLAFHPTQPILLSSSPAGLLYLHRIDSAAHPTPNPEILSVQPKHVDVRRSEFLGPRGSRVLFAGRRRYIHSWDLDTGLVQRTSQVLGHKLEYRSMENFRLSPCGRWVAIQATTRKGGGEISILNAATMQWVAAARLDGRNGIAEFAWWRDGQGMTILGKDGRVGEWSIGSGAFLAIWADEGCVGGIVVALGGSQGPGGVGGDRWVAIGSSSGIMNLYDRQALFSETEDGVVAARTTRPAPTKTFEQLVTPITSLAFSPDGQLLCFASEPKKDALKLVHVPSATVYKNWPTHETPLGRVTTVAFAKHDSSMAIGNDVGRIRLWDIRG